MINNIKKFIISTLVLGSASLAASVDLPDHFTVRERLFTFMATFDVESPRYRLGYAQRSFSIVPEYVLYDYQHQPQFSARMRWTFFGVSFDIADQDGRKMGIVDERIFTLFPAFDIISVDGEKLATARMNFWGTTYTVTDPATSEVIATISRPFFNFFGDTWSVDIINHGLLKRNGIDPAEFVLIAVFQTNREYWERVRREQQQEQDRNHSFKMTERADLLPAVTEQVEAYRDEFSAIDPTEADFESIEQKVEEMYNDETGLTPSVGKEGLISDLYQVAQLLADDNLSIGEKAALHQILEERLNHLQ